MRAIVEKTLCTGCGLCRDLCPEVFGVEGFAAFVRVETVPPEAEAACRKAACRCPLAAIELPE